MDEKSTDEIIRDLRNDLAKWRGRAVEAVEYACSMCRNTDLDLCRYCRMQKIREEAGWK